jgi:hypothetical protein
LNQVQEVARPLFVRLLRTMARINDAHTNGPQVVVQETFQLEESENVPGHPTHAFY